MASTNKTANLHLNQWAASDPVLREDFNADNAALDAAFGSICCVKLREATLTQGAHSVEFDLSDLNPDDYAELKFILYLGAAGYGSQNYFYAYFNSVADVSTTEIGIRTFGSTSTSTSYGGLSGNMPSNESQTPAVLTISLSPGLKSASGWRFYVGKWQNAVSRTVPEVWGGHFTLYTAALQKLIVQKDMTDASYIAAGSKILIYGVRK